MRELAVRQCQEERHDDAQMGREPERHGPVVPLDDISAICDVVIANAVPVGEAVARPKRIPL